jgi:Fur family transcriptional regulator, ferric uptake regulator
MSCIETLKQKDLKLTPQRRLIVDIIHEAHGHLSAETLIALVQKRMPGVNKSTIYRTLEILEKIGCVYKSESGDHAIYHHAEEGHHHHLTCRKCGKTVECNRAIFSSVERSLLKEFGFSPEFNHLVIEGLCADCRK